MVSAIITLTAIGAITGAALSVASGKFAVERDPRQQAVQDLLPNTNCGACGLPGCAAVAAAIAAGKAEATACPITRPDAVEAIAKVMGVTVSIGPRKVARLLCQGGKEISPPAADYHGVMDCRVMAAVSGGGKACVYGCMGGGTCAAACVYDALHMGDNGLPVVDIDKCTSCGLCVSACPRNLMRLIPLDKPVYVACLSEDKGADVRKICARGCIACKICEKACPSGAITVDRLLAEIDPDRCTVNGICVEKCPQKTIL